MVIRELPTETKREDLMAGQTTSLLDTTRFSNEASSIQITEEMLAAGVAANVDFGDRPPWEAREFAAAVYVAMETARRRAAQQVR